MSYWRGLSSRASIIARRKQHHPCISHILHDDDVVSEPSPSPNTNHFLTQKRFFSLDSKVSGFGGFAQNRRISNALLSSPPAGFGFARNMSTAGGGGADKIGLFSDVPEILSDTTVQAVTSQLPVVNEVAIAAADSYLPVKGLQYLIDYVHTTAGLSWWAAIVVTTLLIRSCTVPLLVNQLKATAKLTLMRPRLEELKQEMEEKGMDLGAKIEYQKKIKMLFKEYGCSPLTPLKGLFIQAPVFISFFLAISNMAEKVPSFKDGGAYWFVDLTTPDPMYIFPVLAGLTFLITVECNLQEGMEGNPVAKTMKNVSRGMAVLTVPFTMGFPKAVFCYWVTSNLFSLGYGIVIKNPFVKKTLGLPQLPTPAPQPQGSQQSAFSLFSQMKQLAAAPEPASSTVQPAKIQDRRTSSTSDLSQRIKSLEKKVKGKKRNKKR
ncbi:putative membrane insertase OXA1/ALB3/YidC, membrane insertase YidC/Oxa1 [Rosa chinensis]|uniref:Putative membrane insertase OXA1/ALB3/YidC, membrane insertase YidC/Oxa1 n=1 Tax=Rosa chinensis TaxID=74649 RepID=A0A2P6P669_ROSCH|nr:mitochondrial inner membrane protein OXA1 [Rosa chinensis]PRQ17431.1 putative membrane insertase OXA1/ALB3/YidC, membrane insertase YidC/Oxa1 [Rosa chinensis]